MAHCVHRLVSLKAFPPFLNGFILQAAGNQLLFLYHSQDLQCHCGMKVQPAGTDRPAGHMSHGSLHTGYSLFLHHFQFDRGCKIFCELAAANGISLTVQVEHPNVAHTVTGQGVSCNHIGCDLWDCPALQYFLDVRAVVWKVVFGVYRRLISAVKNGVEILIGRGLNLGLHTASSPLSVFQRLPAARPGARCLYPICMQP